MKQRQNPLNRALLSLMTFALLVTTVIVGCAPVKPATPSQSNAAPGARKQVLLINSYHPGYKFSDDIMRAVAETFMEQGNIDLRIEYLDTKRINSQEYLDQVQQLYQTKYKDIHLDLIMSSDDAALNFLFTYADTLFPNIPVVFVGANFFDVSRLAGYERFTGISEEVDIPGTLNVALRLHPNVKQIVVVNDTTLTGQIIHKIIAEEISPQYPEISFEFLEDVTMDEVRQHVGTLSPESLVLLTIFSRDKAGAFYEYDQFTSIVAQSSSVPVYGAWDFSLGYGIVGGKLVSGYSEGERAAEVAVQILNGKNPATIPVDKQIHSRDMFDYKVLEKWKINIARLPQDSFVLDRPVTFYEENKALVWVTSIGFLVLLVVIIFLVINNTQRRLAQQELIHSNRELKTFQVSLEQRVQERTKALTISSEVSRQLSSILDRSQLVAEIVNQIQKSYNYYHVHIYLMDEKNDKLVMAGGTGEAGKILLERKHSIPRGKGLVGSAAESGETVIVGDTTRDKDWLPNPLLPETKSEISVPIVTGDGKVLGVLDVQNNVADSLTEQDAEVVGAIASQVAVALKNIESYERAEQSIQDLNSQRYALDQHSIVAITDVTGRITYANDKFVEISKYSREELIGQDHRILNSGHHPKEFMRNLWVTIANGKVFHAEIRNKAKDGSLYWVDTTIVPFLNAEGKPYQYVAIRTDITQRKKDEEALAKRTAELEAITSINEKIQSTTTIEAALQITARELGHVFGKKPAAVSLDVDTFSAGDTEKNN